MLSKLTAHPSTGVRKVVCETLVTLIDRVGEHLLPLLPSLTEFFLTVRCLPVYTYDLRSHHSIGVQVLKGLVLSRSSSLLSLPVVILPPPCCRSPFLFRSSSLLLSPRFHSFLLPPVSPHRTPPVPLSQTCQNERDPEVLMSALEYWAALSEAMVGGRREVRGLIQSKFPVYVCPIRRVCVCVLAHFPLYACFQGHVCARFEACSPHADSFPCWSRSCGTVRRT